jgi:spermidine synthase
MSFPPPIFVEVEYLRALRACLRPGGLLLINYGVHTKKMRREVVQRTHQVFPECGVYEIAIETDQNKFVPFLFFA